MCSRKNQSPPHYNMRTLIVFHNFALKVPSYIFVDEMAGGWLSGLTKLSNNPAPDPAPPPREMVVRLQEGDRLALKPVAQAARALGIRITDGDNWSVLWGYKTPWRVETFLQRRRKHPGSSFVVNHLPGTLSLASKVDLVQFTARVASALPRALRGLTPETYALPDNATQFAAALRRIGVLDSNGWPNWLVKSKQHRGVFALSSGSEQSLASLGSALVQVSDGIAPDMPPGHCTHRHTPHPAARPQVEIAGAAGVALRASTQERVRPLLLPGLRRAFDLGLYGPPFPAPWRPWPLRHA